MNSRYNNCKNQDLQEYLMNYHQHNLLAHFGIIEGEVVTRESQGLSPSRLMEVPEPEKLKVYSFQLSPMQHDIISQVLIMITRMVS